MDENSNVPEVRSGNGASSSIRALTKIDPVAWSNDRLHWIYRQVMSQDYAFDDQSENNPQAFLGQLFDPMTEWYEYRDDGLAMVNGITPRATAFVHFVVWGDIEVRDIYTVQRSLFDDLFKRFQLNRLTAFIPAFNKQALRMATLVGMKYEGEMRKAFLKHGQYHNVQFYGILRSEFYKPEEVRS